MAKTSFPPPERAWHTSRSSRSVAAPGGWPDRVLAAGAGAVTMFLFDPVRGRRRRSLVRDQVVHAMHRTARFAGATSRDVQNRVEAIPARMRSRLDHQPVDDVVLAERVRAELGRVCRHRRAVDVTARDGVVTLRGPMLEGDVRRVRRAVRAVPGVRAVDDRMEVHSRPGSVPALQGMAASHPRRLRSPTCSSAIGHRRPAPSWRPRERGWRRRGCAAAVGWARLSAWPAGWLRPGG